MRSFGIGSDPRVLSEMLVMLILRGSSDELRFTQEEHEQLRQAFPNGFALVAYGDPDQNDLRLRVVGSESTAMIEQIYQELQDGDLDTLERLFRQERERRG